MTLFIKPLSSRTLTLSVVSTDSFKTIKTQIHTILNLPIDDQVLFFNLKQLEDDETLNYYTIPDNSTLILTNKTKTVLIPISVQLPEGKTVDLIVEPEMKVSDLKLMISEKLSIPIIYQNLIYSGNVLEDQKVLIEYSIKKDSLIRLHTQDPLVETVISESIKSTSDEIASIVQLNVVLKQMPFHENIQSNIDMNQKPANNGIQIKLSFQHPSSVTSLKTLFATDKNFFIANNATHLMNFMSDAIEGLSHLQKNGIAHSKLMLESIYYWKSSNQYKIVLDSKSQIVGFVDPKTKSNEASIKKAFKSDQIDLGRIILHLANVVSFEEFDINQAKLYLINRYFWKISVQKVVECAQSLLINPDDNSSFQQVKTILQKSNKGENLIQEIKLQKDSTAQSAFHLSPAHKIDLASTLSKIVAKNMMNESGSESSQRELISQYTEVIHKAVQSNESLFSNAKESKMTKLIDENSMLEKELAILQSQEETKSLQKLEVMKKLKSAQDEISQQKSVDENTKKIKSFTQESEYLQNQLESIQTKKSSLNKSIQLKTEQMKTEVDKSDFEINEKHYASGCVLNFHLLQVKNINSLDQLSLVLEETEKMIAKYGTKLEPHPYYKMHNLHASEAEIKKSEDILKDAKSNNHHAVLGVEILQALSKSQGVNLLLTDTETKKEFEFMHALATGSLFKPLIKVQFNNLHEKDLEMMVRDVNKAKELYELAKKKLIESQVIPDLKKSEIEIIGVECNCISFITIVSRDDIGNVSWQQSDIQINSQSITRILNLSMEQFDKKGNMTWGDNFKFKEQRGGMDYYFPRGWTGIGLKVAGKYDNQSDIWLNDWVQGWAVAFHGMRNNPQATVPSIVNGGFRPGCHNAYQNAVDTRDPSRRVGVGIYFGKNAQVSEKGYSTPVAVGNKSYKILLQCRLKPAEVRIPQKRSDIQNQCGNPDWDNDYLIVPSGEHVRPYRILIKEV